MGKSKAKTPSPNKDTTANNTTANNTSLSDLESSVMDETSGDGSGGGVTEVILEVTCGPNKAEFYLHRLKMGSKGTSVLFENAWFTPNGFQFVSGRGTAKDWKRSIKHHGRSLKLLMSKGLVTVTPPCCMCEICEPDGPEAREKAAQAAAQEAGEIISPKKRSKETLGERRASNDSLDSSVKSRLKNSLKAKGIVVPAEEMSDPTIQRDENMAPASVVFPVPIPVTEADMMDAPEPPSSPEATAENTSDTSAQEENNNAMEYIKKLEAEVEEIRGGMATGKLMTKDGEGSTSEDVMIDSKPEATKEDVMDREPPTLEEPKTPEDQSKEDAERSPPVLPMNGEVMESLSVDTTQPENKTNAKEIPSPEKSRLVSIAEDMKTYKAQLITNIKQQKESDAERPGSGCPSETASSPTPSPRASPAQSPAQSSPQQAKQASPGAQQALPGQAPSPTSQASLADYWSTSGVYPFPGVSPAAMITVASMETAMTQSQALCQYYSDLRSALANNGIGLSPGASQSQASPQLSSAAMTMTTTTPMMPKKKSRKRKSAPAAVPKTEDARNTLLGRYLSCQCHNEGYKESHMPSCLVNQFHTIYPTFYSSNSTMTNSTPSTSSLSATASKPSTYTTVNNGSSKASPLSSHTIHHTLNDSAMDQDVKFPMAIAKFSPSKGVGYLNGYEFDKDGAMNLCVRNKRPTISDFDNGDADIKHKKSKVEPILDLTVKKA